MYLIYLNVFFKKKHGSCSFNCLKPAWTRKIYTFFGGIDVVHGYLIGWLDGCGLLLVALMWVTGCPALTLVNTSSEKRRDARGMGSYFD